LFFDVDAGRGGARDPSRAVWYATDFGSNKRLREAVKSTPVPFTRAPTDPGVTVVQCKICRGLLACGDPGYSACKCGNLTVDRGVLSARQVHNVALATVRPPASD
jgi:hypothetical protein